MNTPISWISLIGAGLLVLVAAVFVAIMLFRDPRRHIRRCSKCWYDLSAVQGMRCPECGRVHADEASLHRTRRRWKLALLALPVLLLAAGFAAGRARLTRAYYAAMPKWKAVERKTFDSCEVTRYVTLDPDGIGQRAVVRYRGREIAAVEDFKVEFDAAAAPGLSGLAKSGDDLTNDGVPDVVLAGYSGGAHCCWTYHVIQLGSAPSELEQLDAPNGGVFVRGPDGRVIYRTVETAFNYWRSAYAASPRPDVVLIWRSGMFRLSSEHMRTPEPTQAKLDSLAAAIPADAREKEIPPAFFGAVIELIYDGHPDVAWMFFDRHWSPAWGDKERFRAELKTKLESSPFWPGVHAMGNGN